MFQQTCWSSELISRRFDIIKFVFSVFVSDCDLFSRKEYFYPFERFAVYWSFNQSKNGKSSDFKILGQNQAVVINLEAVFSWLNFEFGLRSSIKRNDFVFANCDCWKYKSSVFVWCYVAKGIVLFVPFYCWC